MPRTPNDDRSDALKPKDPLHPSDRDPHVDQPPPARERSEGGNARDQGDQTEDNRQQQE